jgi:hypothetical protein
MTTERPTVEVLRKEFRYNPLTGELLRSNGKNACKPMNKGYLNVYFRGNTHKAHILAWAIHYGAYPKQLLDHVNRIRTDNRICNLREATPEQNCRNAKLRRDNTSGHKGVWWHSQSGKWEAVVRVNRKQKVVGRFKIKEDAVKARIAAAEKQYKEFASHE